MAYYSVIWTMQNQAQSFDLGLDDVGLQGFDADRDVLSALPVTTETRDRRLLAAEDALMRDYERRGRARWWTLRRYLRASDRSPDK
jgi:hypothetical protein